MRRRRRGALRALGATAAVGALAAALQMAPTASADVAGPYFATQGNGSDPHMIECTDPDTDTDGYCLYTSRDMGQQYAYDGNYYPMQYTRVYFSTTGFDGWQYKGTVFSESTLWVSNGGWVPDNAYHLWAPAAVRNGDYYYLYVPDVSDISNDAPPNISTTSRIAVSRSTSPFGPFEYLGTVPYSSGYMSDPDVFVEGDNRYIIWANGDNGTCGGFSSARLNTNMRTLVSGSTQELVVNGVGVLGNCGGKGRPYMEGASLYKFGENSMPGPYTLVFAAKPTSVPFQCRAEYTGAGSGDSMFEVIAYATATTPQGPYTYKGIIMCGSTTEWTNQATIMQVENETGSNPWIIVYHDSPADIKMRKLHAECLFAGSYGGTEGLIAGVYRQPLDAANGFNDCMDGDNFNYSAYRVKEAVTPFFPTPALVSAASGGNDLLRLNRFAVGAWERFRQYDLGSGYVAFRALANGKYVCVSAEIGRLKPECDSTSESRARFLKVGNNSAFVLQSVSTGNWVAAVKSFDGSVFLGSHLTQAQASVFTEMHLR